MDENWRVPDLYAQSVPTADPQRSMSRASHKSISVVTIEVDDELIIATLTGIEGKLKNPGGLMAQLAELLLDRTVERFQTGTAPDGTPLAPKSLSSITNFATASDDGWARIRSRAIPSAVMPFGAFMGIDKRGRRHFHSIPWGDIPARPFLWISAEENVIAAIEEWIVD